jgi:hypothetical protein
MLLHILTLITLVSAAVLGLLSKGRTVTESQQVAT